MQCFEPISIPRPNGRGKADRITVPCGKCAACLTNRRNDWSRRLAFEHENSTSAYFVTLTYDDDNIVYGAYYGTLIKKHLQDYIKRIRDAIKPDKIRYYAVGEYGTATKRPHYHILIFNLPPGELYRIAEKWTYGYIQVGQVTGASIHYVTKYHVNRNDHPDGSAPGFTIQSSKPGIGYAYIEKNRQYHEGNPLRGHLFLRGGLKCRLPRYYKDKLYNSTERERMSSKVVSPEFDDNRIDEHYRNNPDVNYYDYLLQQKDDYSKKFKIKINKNNKL